MTSRWWLLALAAVALVSFGVVGVARYVNDFWNYRGFPPPTHVQSVIVGVGPRQRAVHVVEGKVATFDLVSPSLGGRSMSILVYTPPGYRPSGTARYPVLFLLHGNPGSPAQFVNVGDLQTKADVLIAERRIRPMIVVMPSGSTSFFADHEWANAIQPHELWENYVAYDLVRAIDRRYRTYAVGSERAIGGLSEGGYGALNIAFHHPDEFQVIESWSGYYHADRRSRLFGQSHALLAAQSPASEVIAVAPILRTRHVFIWFYTAKRDRTIGPSETFARLLTSLHVAHRYFEPPGRHDWSIWRRYMDEALIVASDHFGGRSATA